MHKNLLVLGIIFSLVGLILIIINLMVPYQFYKVGSEYSAGTFSTTNVPRLLILQPNSTQLQEIKTVYDTSVGEKVFKSMANILTFEKFNSTITYIRADPRYFAYFVLKMYPEPILYHEDLLTCYYTFCKGYSSSITISAEADYPFEVFILDSRFNKVYASKAFLTSDEKYMVIGEVGVNWEIPFLKPYYIGFKNLANEENWIKNIDVALYEKFVAVEVDTPNWRNILLLFVLLGPGLILLEITVDHFLPIIARVIKFFAR
ncbi:MAG: hypothetical protein ACP5LN_10925 [Thermoproteota archaeon]